MKTPVSLLQEYCTRNQVIPHYDLICSETGTHNPYFEYKLTVKDVVAFGNGKSKKEAKQEAACKALNLLPESKNGNKGQSDVTTASSDECLYENVTSPYQNAVKHNSVCELHVICANKTLPKPEFHLVGEVGPPHSKMFTFECRVSNYKELGEARTKQQAKQLSSMKMIDRLKAVFGSALFETAVKKEESKEVVDKVCEIVRETKKTKGRTINWLENFRTPFSEFSFNLQDICNTASLPDLKTYNPNINENSIDPCELLISLFDSCKGNVIFELLPSNNKICYVCKFDFSPHFVTFGSGSTEIEAKKHSAHNMLMILKDFV